LQFGNIIARPLAAGAGRKIAVGWPHDWLCDGLGMGTHGLTLLNPSNMDTLVNQVNKETLTNRKALEITKIRVRALKN
jgi:hypothetical protein